ncbi:hypothetical protein DMN91_005360 [Ooceraea biroi]|uniref:Transmembrane protein 177 n=1 Tax=Ooceraea biroi TaxID=2015173 RepID=A0A026WYV5_OOCBI|nr:transmembrane protein 177 [Ooceraea biroi]XP_011351719.1 transmembrane protein 177 [Ooceraea biroi]EZA61202.1 hypothetical protein X777_08414 [Ooceraea biroi]RLU23082.1 hypothetical protein DMN91_005360 [Ooceraea biroi]
MNVFSSKYRTVVLGITATAIGYYGILMPHTIFLDKYRAIVTTYQLGKEIPLSAKAMQNIREAMNDLKLSDNVRNVIKPFSVFGFDLYHAGTLGPKYGAILGIPCNLNSTAEQLYENLRIKEEEVDWSQKEAQDLLSASTLSTSAQKFAIAREILLIQAEVPYSNSFQLALIVAVLWTLCNTMTYKFKLRERSVTLCRILYMAFTLFGAILWLGIKDYQSYRLDSEVDKVLCGLGAEYVKGGQEFYEKTLIRNRALRSLLGKDGEKIYTAGGNEQTLFRQKHVMLSHRKEFFDSYSVDC